MRLLLDTHLLLWTASEPEKLSSRAEGLIADPRNELFFSVVNVWEIAIKYGLGKLDVKTSPRGLRQGLLQNGCQELEITAEHALIAGALPLLHRDPFDRLLISQARAENMILITSDSKLTLYRDPVQVV